ncbi:MAG: nucleoside triphosphate pyrophosphohydrolase [Candidatus Saccharimonadaceae bacterium]
MGSINYQKLVRDKIPEIISADGHRPETRILSREEYRTKLLEKLVEEAKELLESNGDISERADVAEVLKAIDEILNFSDEEIEQARNAKFQERGGFALKIFLEKVETDD